jgi:hypothetical protein
MLKNKVFRLTTLFTIFVLLSVGIVAKPASALISQNVTSWYTTSDTSITGVAMGDVNGDGKTEIVTVGYFNDGVRFNAQLAVWNASTMTGITAMNWFWTGDTKVTSVALANITGGVGLDIVTGGDFFDGTRWNGQIIIWNGTTLVGQRVSNYFWVGDTNIASIAVGNVSRGTGLDIVVGGAFFDGTRWNSQLTVWNATNLVGEKLVNWFFTGDTTINSVTIANVSGGSGLEVVTGGSFFDGTRNNAQLIVWNGSTLVGERIVNWFVTGATEVNSVAVANVTGGTALDIVTGGSSFDGTRNNAQLIMWNGSNLVGERIVTWFTTGATRINSVAIGNFTGAANLDVISGGVYNDGLRNNAQLIVWNGATLVGQSMITWVGTSDTEINSIFNGNINLGAISGNRVLVGGDYFDTARLNAQLTLWA